MAGFTIQCMARILMSRMQRIGIEIEESLAHAGYSVHGAPRGGLAIRRGHGLMETDGRNKTA